MGFADRYVHAVNSCNLQDDAFHHDTEALFAAAVADANGFGLGALLARVKYADGTMHKLFEGNPGNLSRLLKIWEAEVTRKGKERGWVKITSERDIITAHSLYRRVAMASMAHFLDGLCRECNGTGTAVRSLRNCVACGGTGDAPIECSGGYERERIKDMVSEIKALATSHAGRASQKMGRDT